MFAGKDDDSVFFHTWHEVPVPRTGAELLAKWARLRELRDAGAQGDRGAARAKARSARRCRPRSTSARPARTTTLLASLGEELKFVLITSAARACAAKALAASRSAASAHPKCERCWHYRADVNGEGLCGALPEQPAAAPGETRKHV